jgi:hypothetical protein
MAGFDGETRGCEGIEEVEGRRRTVRALLAGAKIRKTANELFVADGRREHFL